jgi:hypothetical protein
MSWNLLVSCPAALGCMQLVCWALARGLGLRLSARAMAMGLCLPVAVLAPFLFGSDVLAPTGTLNQVMPGARADPAHMTHLMMSDTTYQFLPWELEVRHALRERRLPLWSDRLDGGSSPWLNPQAAVLSPIAMLARLAPIQDFLLLALALKLLVACEGAWLLVRRLGCSRVAALLAAASFAVGGGLMSWALFPHSATVAWVPWLAAGAIVLCRRPAPRAIAATAAITAALLLSGHPETALAGGLFAALCGLALRRRRAGWRGVAAAGLAAAIGCGLAAPQVAPFLHAVPQSQRARDMLALALPPDHFAALRPATWFLPNTVAYLKSPVNPRAFGLPYGEAFNGPYNWVDALSAYAGLVAFAGAVVAALALRRRRVWPFVGFAAAVLLLVAGFLPLARLIHAVPALRVPAWSRMLPVSCLALAVAAAFGCDLLLYGRGLGRPASGEPGDGDHGRRRLRRRGLQVAAALAAAAAVSVAVDGAPEVLAVWGLIGAAALAARWRPAAGAWLLVLALGLDLAPWSQRLLPHGEPGLFYRSNPLMAALQRETAGGRWRAVGMDLLVYPSLLPVYGLDEVRVNNVLAPSDHLRVLRLAFGFDPSISNYYATFPRADHPLLSFLNVRVVVGNAYVRPRGLAPLPPEPGVLPFELFVNRAALPRWFVPEAVDVIDPAAFPAWLAGLAAPGRVAVYRAQIGSWQPPAAAAAPLGARLLAGAPGHLELAVPGSGRRLLATSLPSPEGWRAHAGGQSLPTVTVDGAFLGALVPAGASRVTLDFRPPGFAAGLAVCALAVAALAVLAWRPARAARAARATLP